MERTIPQPLPDHPGNVFLEGEEVEIAVPEAEGRVGWMCLNYERETVVKGEGARAALGRLPVGYYEVWSVDAQGARLRKTTVGVLAPLPAPVPDDSPIAVDAAAAWFCGERPERARALASLAALAGCNWVRDRLAWGTVEPERGVFPDHTFYDDTARLQAEAGLKALQVFHGSPGWANPDGRRFPLDLLDLYRFVKTASARWRGQVRAWEPWNEADIAVFGGHTGSEIATLQKAAYWALRAGNPDAVVCLNCLAWGPARTLANLVENEPWAYFDTFNFHHYRGIDEFPPYYATMRAASGGRPLWVTEAGVHVRFQEGDPEQEPPWEEQQRQARYVTQCFAASLHEGSAATFYFLLPHYVEGQVQFGLTHQDLTPRLSYLALAAAGRMLTGARPLGSLRVEEGSPLRVFAFRARPDGEERTVLVIWSQRGDVEVPALHKILADAAYDALGRPLPVLRDPPMAQPHPIYLVYQAGIEQRLDLLPPPQPARWIEATPCPLVIQLLLPPERVLLDASAYRLEAGETLELPVYAYNFGKQAIRTTLTAAAAEPLRIDPEDAEVAVEPLQRAELRFQVRAPEEATVPDGASVRFAADCGGEGSALLVTRFVVPPSQSRPDGG